MYIHIQEHDDMTPTIKTFVEQNIKRHYNGLQYLGTVLSNAWVFTQMVDELHKEELKLGSKRELNQRYVTRAMECIEYDYLVFAWKRNAEQTAYFLKHDSELA